MGPFARRLIALVLVAALLASGCRTVKNGWCLRQQRDVEYWLEDHRPVRNALLGAGLVVLAAGIAAGFVALWWLHCQAESGGGEGDDDCWFRIGSGPTGVRTA
jgi:hypothetical protein